MIVRELLQHPEEIANGTFDMCNDAEDTIAWLRRGGHTKLADELEAGFEQYLTNCRTRIRAAIIATQEELLCAPQTVHSEPVSTSSSARAAERDLSFEI